MIHVFSCFDKSLQDHVLHVKNSVERNTTENIVFHAAYNVCVDDNHERIYKDNGIITHRVHFHDIPVNHKGIVQSSSMFMRWLIPSLTSASRAVYLDNDVIVVGDIAEMHDIRLGNNLIGAVKDRYAQCMIHAEHHQGTIPGSSWLPSYFSGQLVINCDAWRKESITERLINIAIKHNVLDMAALNYVCAGRIKEIPGEWCISANYDDAPKNAKLLHWHGRSKPWNEKCRNQSYYDRYVK